MMSSHRVLNECLPEGATGYIFASIVSVSQSDWTDEIF